MLHSHSFQDKAFDSFASFIRNILKGDDRYKALVKPIISDAVSLVRKKMDYYRVNRDALDVIVFLAEKDPAFIKTLDADQLSTENYRRILELISDQREATIA